MENRRKKWLTALLIALFVAAMFVLAALLGKPVIELASEPERIREWVDARGAMGRFMFLGMVILQLIVAVIPGEPLEIAAGYAFGAIEGTALCLLGAVIGSALVFMFVRKFGVKALEVFFSREKIDSVKFLKDSDRLNAIVFIVFLIPGTPKDVLCYGVGLTKMRLSTWMIITSIARIPSIVTSTIGGNALGTGEFAFAAIVFGATILVSVAGLMIYKRTRAKRDKEAQTRAELKQARALRRAAKKEKRARERSRARNMFALTSSRALRKRARKRSSSAEASGEAPQACPPEQGGNI